MANKSVTITEPVANDVLTINVRCDGSGNVTALTGTVRAVSDDAAASHRDTFSFDVSSLPGPVQTAISDLAAECLTQFKTEHGF